MSNIKLMLKIDGLKKAIEIVKNTIDVEAFCNHQSTTPEYFTDVTITKTVRAIQKEIDRLETIERDNANIQRVDNQITK